MLNTQLSLHGVQKSSFLFRFGLINGVVATRNIQKGSQIFLSYVYPPTNSPSWYEELNLKMIREFETKFG